MKQRFKRLKRAVLFPLFSIANSFVWCQNQNLAEQSPEVVSVTIDLHDTRRDYASCGTMKYTIVIGALVVDGPKNLIGQQVALYVMCPETMNDLPIASRYKAEVSPIDQGADLGVIMPQPGISAESAQFRVWSINTSP